MRKILLYFAIKYQGNYHLIYEALKRKEKVSQEDLKGIDENCNYITILDEEYPEKLKNISNPPFVLFYKGDLSLLNSSKTNLAIIGTRSCSQYGIEMTEKIVNDLKDGEYIISSGLAKGIDSHAHLNSFKANLKTIAILGSGINCCYPLVNQQIYDRISKEGLLVSEYPDNIPARPEHFLIRNRILAAISDIIVIIEAKYRSGTMNTVTYGLEYGKEICCVPALANTNSGCNLLIKQGAKLIECGNDIFE